MILITGANGNLGTNVVHQLLKVGKKDEFIATASNAESLQQLQQKGLLARVANFDDSNSLKEAFAAIDKLLLISTMSPNRFEQHKNVIDAAKQLGVKHIIYTSLAVNNIEYSGVKQLMISHFQTEDYIKSSGLTYTILRNTMYADALSEILGTNAINDNISLPGGDGKVPYALRREMGEATANLLLQQGHENAIYNITGTQLLGYQEIAETLTKLTGTQINYNNTTEETYKIHLQKMGLPDFSIYLHTGTVYDIKNHQYEVSSANIMEQLLGRPTASADDFLTEIFKLQYAT